jgi:hypothetical protein
MGGVILIRKFVVVEARKRIRGALAMLGRQFCLS